MTRKYILVVLAVILPASVPVEARNRIHITHAYANTNAQSLIGLPMGSHKTIVDKQGNLHWSQWSLKRRGLDVPFGFSAQMDGTLAIQMLRAGLPLKVTGQQLYHNRFPFIVTHLAGGGLEAEEVAFSAESGAGGLDIVRVRLRNTGASPASIEIRLSGKRHNLPAFASGPMLATRDGFLVALAQAQSGTFSAVNQNLLLDYKSNVPTHSTSTIWLKLPCNLLVKQKAAVAATSGPDLLKRATQSWETFWAAGTQIESRTITTRRWHML